MKRVVILVALLIGLSVLFGYQSFTFSDGKLHLTFCDVGQGDAIFIRTPNGSDILVDGGPDDSVLTCLGKHMPFWDRDLELVILTHPHADHFQGLFSVFKTYRVKAFATEDLKNKTVGFNNLMELIQAQGIPRRFVLAGDRFRLKGGVILEIVGPTQEFIDQTSPGGTIGESSEFASVLTKVRYGKFVALLTGDSQASELEDALRLASLAQGFRPVPVLQVPHHGSKTGLNQNILNVLDPKLAVISVGKNSFGHPTGFILDLLKSKNIKTLRTDQNGEVEIISDGNDLQIRTKISNK